MIERRGDEYQIPDLPPAPRMAGSPCRLGAGFSPDLWIASKTTPEQRALAAHLCRRHCPVLEHCAYWAKAVYPRGQVMGGIWWARARPRLVRPAATCKLCPPPKSWTFVYVWEIKTSRPVLTNLTRQARPKLAALAEAHDVKLLGRTAWRIASGTEMPGWAHTDKILVASTPACRTNDHQAVAA